MDGLDMCLTELSLSKDYNLIYRILSCKYEKFDKNTIDLIKKTIDDNNYLPDLDNHLGIFFLNSVKKYYSKKDMDIISMHGQTVKHIDRVQSIQSGDPSFLNQEFAVPVIYNFRHADIIKGGNGAPLVPFLDWLLFKDYDFDVVTLNLGGISNITYIKKQSTLNDIIGFDTGPGMSLIDEFVFLIWGLKYDDSGLLASKGNVNKNLLTYLMDNNYIMRKPPKSTGRHEFGINLIKNSISKFKNINKFDFLRTLVMFTAKSIISNLKYLDNFYAEESTLIISGGGINNKLLMDDIKKNSTFHNVITSNEVGINPDFKEALLMSVLGLGRVNKLKTNVPSVTGASKFVSCGDIYE